MTALLRLPGHLRQADYAIEYIKKHAKDDKPFFMDVNFMKMHNPTNAAPKFAGKSHLGDYSDSLMELDDNIGRVMDDIRAEAPNAIVIVTADNGALAGRLSRRRHYAFPRRERHGV
jgi:arylsulfatase